MTAVLVIDDHPIVLQGCRMVLKDAGVDEVHVATRASAGFRIWRNAKPDLIVLDLSLRRSHLDGVPFIRRLRAFDGKTPILVLSMHEAPAVVRRVIDAGANGFILKDSWHDEFVGAFQHVLRGGRYVSHRLACGFAFEGQMLPETSDGLLSPRDAEVFRLLGLGRSSAEIAGEMKLNPKTIANRISRLKERLGAGSINELIKQAVTARDG